MKKLKPLIPSLVALISTAGLITYSTCSFAESNHPPKGSVTFGAEKKPDINTPPQLSAFSNMFADIAEKVVPTVVQVVPTKIDTVIFSNNPFINSSVILLASMNSLATSDNSGVNHWSEREFK